MLRRVSWSSAIFPALLVQSEAENIIVSGKRWVNLHQLGRQRDVRVPIGTDVFHLMQIEPDIHRRPREKIKAEPEERVTVIHVWLDKGMHTDLFLYDPQNLWHSDIRFDPVCHTRHRSPASAPYRPRTSKGRGFRWDTVTPPRNSRVRVGFQSGLHHAERKSRTAPGPTRTRDRDRQPGAGGPQNRTLALGVCVRVVAQNRMRSSLRAARESTSRQPAVLSILPNVHIGQRPASHDENICLGRIDHQISVFWQTGSKRGQTHL